MKETILEYITKHEHVSFVELSRNIKGFDGNLDWCIGSNVYFWSGISSEAIDALDELTKERKIDFAPVQPYVYYRDGQRLKLPIASVERVKRNQRCWAPITYSTTAQHKADVARTKRLGHLDALPYPFG